MIRFLRKLAMMFLIPEGLYCYDKYGLCVFYSKICGLEGSANCGYEENISEFDREILLEDQCKICGVKENIKGFK